MQKLESHRRPLTPEEENRLRTERLPTGCGPISYVLFSSVFLFAWLYATWQGDLRTSIAFGLMLAVLAGVMMLIFARLDRSEKRSATRLLKGVLEGARAELYEVSAHAFVVFEQDRDEDDDDEDESGEYAFALNDGRMVFIHGREFQESEKFPCLDFSVTQIFDGYGRVLQTSIEHRGPKARPEKTIPAEITSTLDMPVHLEVRAGKLENLETDLKRVVAARPEKYSYTKGTGMLRKADTEQWRELLDKTMNTRAASTWSKWAKPNVGLTLTPPEDDDLIAPLSSKLGGLPDLPKGMPWPTYQDVPRQRRGGAEKPATPPLQVRPVPFLAQINLADIAKLGCDLPLPESGLLLFFYEPHTYGYCALETTAARVLFVPEGTETERPSVAPIDLAPVRSLAFEAGETLPDVEFVEEHDPAYSREDFEEGDEIRDEDTTFPLRSRSAFGGWPHAVQGTMEWECELYAHQIDAISDRYKEARARGFDKTAIDWRLLLQLDSDDTPELDWGDLGKLYFFCREKDVADRRFERCCVIDQFT